MSGATLGILAILTALILLFVAAIVMFLEVLGKFFE